jgi:hypothetical protein
LGLFEAMLGASVTFGLAIPVFMEKVMRPRYEERFDEFRRTTRQGFLEELEDSVKKLKKSKEEFSPEFTETLEPLFAEWGEVKTNENKLDSLLNRRKYYFSGWMLSTALSLFSIQYSELMVANTNLTLGQVTMLFFGLMLLLSILYVYEQFDLDQKLSKFRSTATSEKLRIVETTRESVVKGRLMEQNVEKYLTQLNVPFQKETGIRLSADYYLRPDFVIPSSADPKYIIEVKRSLSFANLKNVVIMGFNIKTSLTNCKSILISDLRESQANIADLIGDNWNFIIDIEDLEKLRDIIKL